MSDSENLEDLPPVDRVFDGGDLDCGSGLVLLIRDNMLQVPEGGVLEMRSREPTVAADLPPWCRMVGHEYLGASVVRSGDGIPAPAGTARYFVRRGAGVAPEEDRRALEEDREKAKGYEWRLRIRSTGHLESTAYCRNFSFQAGQPASFEEKDRHPSSVELLLGSLGTALATGFATEVARAGLDVDDIELTVRGQLGNPLAHLGLGEGDPGLSRVDVRCFASTMDDEAAVRAAWARTVERSPVAVTLARATELTHHLAIV
ncbi:MAG: OsmC family protein [bacterium]